MISPTRCTLAAAILSTLLATIATSQEHEKAKVSKLFEVYGQQARSDDETIKLIEDVLSSSQELQTATRRELEFCLKANVASDDNCNTGYLEMTKILRDQARRDETVLENYLNNCLSRQLDTCFANLENRFKRAYGKVESHNRKDFDKFAEIIKPQFLDPQDFAVVPKYDRSFDGFVEFIKWKSGNRVQVRENVNSSSSYERFNRMRAHYTNLVKTCVDVYNKFFHPTGLLLYIAMLKPDKVGQLSPELESWYTKSKLAFDLSLNGKKNKEDFLEYTRARGLVVPQSRFDVIRAILTE